MAVFKTTDSPDRRTYYLRVPVRSYWWESARGEQTFGREPRPTPTVAAEIGAVKGIQTFYTHEGYEVKIHKASSYTWEEIEAQIEAAIEKHDAEAEWPTPEEEKIIIPEETHDDSDYED